MSAAGQTPLPDTHETDSTSGRLPWTPLLLVGLPSLAYALLHLLALRRPSALWGVDVLAYYGPAGVAAFLTIPILAVAVPGRWLPAIPAGRRMPVVLAAGSIPLFWLLRVRHHSLGDSDKWFRVVENVVEHTFRWADTPWLNASLSLPGWEWLNVQQAGDLLLHVGLFRLCRQSARSRRNPSMPASASPRGAPTWRRSGALPVASARAPGTRQARARQAPQARR